MSRVFFRDLRCTVYREKSSLTGGAEGLRYIPFEDVAKRVEKVNSQLIVFKMLVESQRAHEFLSVVPNGKVIWLFRNYKDVASSNLHKFGAQNGIDDLRPIVLGTLENWRSQNISTDIRTVVSKHFSETMNPADAAALFWWCRNRLFYEQDLAAEERVMLVEYEGFVTKPVQVMQLVYEFCDVDFLNHTAADEVRETSIAQGFCSSSMEKIRTFISRYLQWN